MNLRRVMRKWAFDGLVQVRSKNHTHLKLLARELGHGRFPFSDSTAPLQHYISKTHFRAVPTGGRSTRGVLSTSRPKTINKGISILELASRSTKRGNQ